MSANPLTCCQTRYDGRRPALFWLPVQLLLGLRMAQDQQPQEPSWALSLCVLFQIKTPPMELLSHLYRKDTGIDMCGPLLQCRKLGLTSFSLLGSNHRWSSHSYINQPIVLRLSCACRISSPWSLMCWPLVGR